MNYRTDYPENLTPGQLWTVPTNVVADAPMLLVTDPGVAGSPLVLAVTRLSDLNDPFLVVVDDTPIGEPLGILTGPPAYVGPQAFGELLGDLMGPAEAYRFGHGSRLTEAVADLGLRYADGPEDTTGMRRLSKSLMDVMMHDPNPTRVDVPLSEALNAGHGLPLEVTTDCCPGKSCGTTTLRLAAFRVIATGEVRLRYARTSNDDDYIVGTRAKLAEFVATRAH